MFPSIIDHHQGELHQVNMYKTLNKININLKLKLKLVIFYDSWYVELHKVEVDAWRIFHMK
jgi:hypothetical protein